jgi:hypothetical protein
VVLEKEEVIVALNKIRDNIWLGDLSEVQKIAYKILDDESSDKLLDEANKTHQIVLELRKQARKENRDSRLWLSDVAQKSFSENKLSSIDYIVGTIIKRLIWITKEVKGAKEESPSIVQRASYKFRVIAKPPKYEVRALLMAKSKLPDEWNQKELAKKLQVQDYSFDIRKTSAILRFFSGNEFIESVILPYSAEVNVVQRELKEDRIGIIADAILSTVTSFNKTQ